MRRIDRVQHSDGGEVRDEILARLHSRRTTHLCRPRPDPSVQREMHRSERLEHGLLSEVWEMPERAKSLESREIYSIFLGIIPFFGLGLVKKTWIKETRLSSWKSFWIQWSKKLNFEMIRSARRSHEFEMPKLQLKELIGFNETFLANPNIFLENFSTIFSYTSRPQKWK